MAANGGQLHLLSSVMFTAQAIALDMEKAGREAEIDTDQPSHLRSRPGISGTGERSRRMKPNGEDNPAFPGADCRSGEPK